MLIDGAAAREAAEEIAEFYALVFTTPPWNEVHTKSREITAGEYHRQLLDDSQRPGFRAAMKSRGDRITAFGAGWTTTHWPTTGVYPGVLRTVGQQAVDDHLLGAFEVNQLAVDPDARGRGLGRAVLNELLTGIERAWLGTYAGAPAAVAFYRHLEWRQLEPVSNTASNIVVFVAPGIFATQ